MLEVGALTTITPAWVAARTSTLSRPTPARATTFSRVAAASASASTLVAERTSSASTSAIAASSSRTVGAVAVADLEVRAERLDGGGAQLFGDEYDGLSWLTAVVLAVVRVEWATERPGTTLCCPATLPRRRPEIRWRPRRSRWLRLTGHIPSPGRSH